MSNKPQDAESKQPDSSFIQLDDAKQKGAASAASAPRRKALVGVLAAACIVLIVVSLGFVYPSDGSAWSIDWIAQAVAGKSVADSGSAASHKTEAGSSSSDAVDSESKEADESDSKADSESSDKDSKKDSKEKKSEGKGGKKSGDKSGSQNSDSTGGPNAFNGSSSGGGSTTGGASTSNGGGAPADGQGGSQQPGYVTVTVSVTSSAVGNPVSSSGTFTFNKGATAYDALCALGLSVNAHGTSYGTYVSAIGGLAEKEHGAKSGWMYSVNGTAPMTACSNFVLPNGANVVWYYVTG